jgi:Spy/CpxP family protein refolding chaperone
MKTIYSLLLLCFLSSPGFAQIQRNITSKNSKDSVMDGTVMAPLKKNAMKEDLRSLNLNKNQLQKIKALKQEDKAAKDDINNDTTLTVVEKKKRFRVLNMTRMEKIKTILTDEQFAKLMEMRKNEKNN